MCNPRASIFGEEGFEDGRSSLFGCHQLTKHHAETKADK